jgi:DNA-binding transcriptional LysR family regulator
MAQAEAFLAVAEELHFGCAADRLHVSQPRVSRLVAALERQIGGALFERTSRRVALTPLGEQFRDELGAAYAQLQAALDHARRAAREAAGQLRIGFTNTTEGPALARLIAVFEARHPGGQVMLQEVPVTDAYGALRAGEIDVLIHWLVVDEPDLTPGPAIDRQDRVVAVAVSHPLARQTAVSVEDLAGQPVARPPATFPFTLWEALVPTNTPSGKPIPQTHEVRSLHEIWALVARGLIVHPTVASTAQLLRRDDIVLVPITGLPPIRLGLIWRSACYNARIRALAATARHIYPAKRPKPSSHPAAPLTQDPAPLPGRAITG